jgi:hypothetical protein
MPRRSHLDEILRLDPERDYLRIVYLNTYHEFPWDMTRALEFALFRTFAVPSIAALLDRTGEFRQRAQKRYDDTDLILTEILENGFDSPRGRTAIQRMNRLHGRFDIANADFLYVLSTFIFEPVRWIERFGWRPMSENGRLAQFYYWQEVGRRMGIADIPASYAEFERFNRAYEAEQYRYTPANQAVSEPVRAMFLSWTLPRPLHRLGAPFTHALMDPPLLAAVGFTEPGRLLRALVSGGLRLRGRLVRMLPERGRPRLRSQLARRQSYPDGYRVEALGPADVPPEPWNTAAYPAALGAEAEGFRKR